MPLGGNLLARSEPSDKGLLPYGAQEKIVSNAHGVSATLQTSSEMDSVSLEIGSSEKGNAEFSGVGESGVGGDASADSSLRDISPKQAFRMPVFLLLRPSASL